MFFMAYNKRLLRKMLRICHEYSYALDNKPIQIFHVQPEQDEWGELKIVKKNGKIKYDFGGNYFSNQKATIDSVSSCLEKFNVSPAELVKYFIDALKKPLGEHLAEKEIASLEKKLQLK